MTTPLFGLDVSTSAAPGADPVRDARHAEDLGFDLVSASDHPAGTEPTYETWTMLIAIAAATSRIRVASRVLGVPFRVPAMVAKMAESLQRLSHGRVILGLGGGASDDEFRGFGLPVPTPREKIDGLDEALQVIRGLWTSSAFTFRGRIHHTDRAELEPKPDLPIPVWLGTFGPRGLAVTGRLADGWIPSLGHAAPEQIPAMRERVMDAARAAGRDPAEITCAYNLGVRLGEPTDDPDVVSGSPEAVAERLTEFVRLGFTVLNLKPAGEQQERREQVERLATEVIPAVRAAAPPRQARGAVTVANANALPGTSVDGILSP